MSAMSWGQIIPLPDGSRHGQKFVTSAVPSIVLLPTTWARSAYLVRPRE